MKDETAGNLGPEARKTVFELLKQRESAMLISIHRIDEVAALVNRTIEMDRGKVIIDK